MARALRSLFADVPIVVVIGGAARWLSLAAGAPGHVFESDDLDAASVYLADLVRSFGTCGISGIAVDLRGEGFPDSAGRVMIHRPVFNVARHYGWTTAVVRDAASAAFDVGDSVDVVLQRDIGLATLPAPNAAPLVGGGLKEDFWVEELTPPLPARGLCYGEIPEHAEPERVLAKLEALRA